MEEPRKRSKSARYDADLLDSFGVLSNEPIQIYAVLVISLPVNVIQNLHISRNKKESTSSTTKSFLMPMKNRLSASKSA